MKARELMTRDPECVTENDTLERAATLMRDRNVGALPVVESNDSRRLIGIVTDRDIAIKHVAEGHGSGCEVGEVMSRGDLATVGEDDDSDRVMSLMQERQVRRIPVVNGDREVVGMIAQADLALQSSDEREVEKTVEKISEPN